MPTYRVTVVRKQSWTFTIAAADKETAMQSGDDMACEEPAHDDWAYETNARKINDEGEEILP